MCRRPLTVLQKLFRNTSGDSAWSLLVLLMRNTQISVCLGARHSRPVTLNQAVGQDRFPSTDKYKLHLNSRLHVLESTNIGSHIGPVFCGPPTGWCHADWWFIYWASIFAGHCFHLLQARTLPHKPINTTIIIYPGIPGTIRNSPMPLWTHWRCHHRINHIIHTSLPQLFCREPTGWPPMSWLTHVSSLPEERVMAW